MKAHRELCHAVYQPRKGSLFQLQSDMVENPPSSRRQRQEPRGVLQNVWAKLICKIPHKRSNTVYRSRNILNRINCKINKEETANQAVLRGRVNVKKTAQRILWFQPYMIQELKSSTNSTFPTLFEEDMAELLNPWATS